MWHWEVVSFNAWTRPALVWPILINCNSFLYLKLLLLQFLTRVHTQMNLITRLQKHYLVLLNESQQVIGKDVEQTQHLRIKQNISQYSLSLISYSHSETTVKLQNFQLHKLLFSSLICMNSGQNYWLKIVQTHYKISSKFFLVLFFCFFATKIITTSKSSSIPHHLFGKKMSFCDSQCSLHQLLPSWVVTCLGLCSLYHKNCT